MTIVFQYPPSCLEGGEGGSELTKIHPIYVDKFFRSIRLGRVADEHKLMETAFDQKDAKEFTKMNRILHWTRSRARGNIAKLVHEPEEGFALQLPFYGSRRLIGTLSLFLWCGMPALLRQYN